MKIHRSKHRYGRQHSYKRGRMGSKDQTRIFKQKDSFLRLSLHSWKSTKNRVLAPKKSLSRGYYSLSELSVCVVLGVPVRSALVLVLHWKCRKQRKEQSHAWCHVTRRIRTFQIFEYVQISKLTDFAVPEAAGTLSLLFKPNSVGNSC